MVPSQALTQEVADAKTTMSQLAGQVEALQDQVQALQQDRRHLRESLDVYEAFAADECNTRALLTESKLRLEASISREQIQDEALQVARSAVVVSETAIEASEQDNLFLREVLQHVEARVQALSQNSLEAVGIVVEVQNRAKTTADNMVAPLCELLASLDVANTRHMQEILDLRELLTQCEKEKTTMDVQLMEHLEQQNYTKDDGRLMILAVSDAENCSLDSRSSQKETLERAHSDNTALSRMVDEWKQKHEDGVHRLLQVENRLEDSLEEISTLSTELQHMRDQAEKGIESRQEIIEQFQDCALDRHLLVQVAQDLERQLMAKGAQEENETSWILEDRLDTLSTSLLLPQSLHPQINPLYSPCKSQLTTLEASNEPGPDVPDVEFCQHWSIMCERLQQQHSLSMQLAHEAHCMLTAQNSSKSDGPSSNPLDMLLVVQALQDAEHYALHSMQTHKDTYNRNEVLCIELTQMKAANHLLTESLTHAEYQFELLQEHHHTTFKHHSSIGS